jgi:hypothetical protein
MFYVHIKYYNMKKMIFTLLILKCSLSFGQFQKVETPKEIIIGKAKSGGVKLSELSYSVYGTDTVYNFKYQDKKFSSGTVWKSVIFKGDSQILTDLYTTLISALDSSKGYEMSFILGESNAFVTTASMMGAKYLKLGFSTSGVIGMTDLTRKQIETLFNKSEE